MLPATLTVWLYDSAMGAAAGEVRLKDLQERKAIKVIDAVTVTWVRGSHEPRVGHLRRSMTSTASRGSILGALVGSLLPARAVGATSGSGGSTLTRSFCGAGIDDAFLSDLKSSLSAGTSALLVLSSDVDLDVVRTFVERGLARGDVRLMHAWLPDDAPEALRKLVDDASGGGDKSHPQAVRST